MSVSVTRARDFCQKARRCRTAVILIVILRRTDNKEHQFVNKMCCGECNSCIVPQTKLLTGCDFFSVNVFLSSLFICTPFSKSRDCDGCCGWLLFILTLPIRIPIGCVLFGAGLLFDMVATVLFIVTLCWCCGKCKKWGCEYCLQTKERMAHDCLYVLIVCECL